MQIVNLAVLGDIHYPVTRNLTGIDAKITPPDGLRKGLAKSLLSCTMQDIITNHSSRPFDCILFVGDFTDKGDVTGFKNCLEYVSSALSGISAPIIGVPGNHDLKAPEKLIDNASRFTEFLAEAVAYSTKLQLSYDAYRCFEKIGPTKAVALYALNSCAGCKELWDTPDKKKLGALLASNSISIPDEELYDVFDAPYLDADAIDRCVAHIQKEDIGLPILLSHHNILPQKHPRIAIFPELLNSGYVRRRLSSIPAPVVYIHGHIHDDAIEVIANPTQLSQAGLISISAPLLSNGYLQVKAILSDDGIPLSISIHIRSSSAMGISEIIKRVPLYSREETEKLLSTKGKDVLQALDSEASNRYKDLGDTFGYDTVEQLECCGLVAIKRVLINASASWIIERAP